VLVLPIPSENFARRGKKVWKFGIPPRITRITRMSRIQSSSGKYEVAGDTPATTEGSEDSEDLPQSDRNHNLCFLCYLLWKEAQRINEFTAAFPRKVFGKRDRRAKGPREDRAVKMPA
jgi:hypothetical protein